MVGLGWAEEDVRRSESCGDEKAWSSGSWSGDTEEEPAGAGQKTGGVWRVNIWLEVIDG